MDGTDTTRVQSHVREVWALVVRGEMRMGGMCARINRRSSRRKPESFACRFYLWVERSL